MAVTVTFKAKSKLPRVPSPVQLKNNELAQVLIRDLSKELKLSPERIRLTVRGETPASDVKPKDKVLSANDVVAEFATNKEITVYVRDLGPQIAWRTVFLIEYLGPLLIHPLFYYGQEYIYGENSGHSGAQHLILVMVLLHFLKREFETAFIHKFSLATMPIFNLFKNCAHYWLLSGVLFAYFVYAPSSWVTKGSKLDSILYSVNPIELTTNQQYVVAAIWAFAELSNFIVHINLSSLRASGSTERKIPYGYGFSRCSSPNYFFESVGWLAVSVLSQNWSVILFFIVGSLQMYVWAIKKHQRYRREFPDYPKKRTPYIPGLC